MRPTRARTRDDDGSPLWLVVGGRTLKAKCARACVEIGCEGNASSNKALIKRPFAHVDKYCCR